jgi:cation-transporting ATPase 13A3/4/5
MWLWLATDPMIVYDFWILFKSAIAQANIGVSFQISDASYIAPFSSKDQSIKSVVKVLLEGRTTTTTLRELFCYYIILSFASLIAQSLLIFEASNYGNLKTRYV